MKYLHLGTVLLTLVSNILFAQNEFGEMEDDPKLLLQEANYQYQDKNYLHALEKYELLDSILPDNVDVKYALAVCYLDVFRHLDKAIDYLKSVKEERPEDATVVFNLAKAYHFSNDIDRAKDHYKEALSIGFVDDTLLTKITKRKIEMCDNAAFYLENPTNASIVNIGDIVNTQYSEYVPIFSKDSSTLVFTYRGPGCTGGLQSSNGAKADNRGFYYEDVFIAYRYDESWTIPVSISDNINTNLHDAVTGLSDDEQTIFVYRSDGSNGEIFESNKDDDWTKPKKLSKTINSKYFEGHAAFTKDGNTMYVTSDRPGGYGGIDIYKSDKDDRGYWGELENLGPRINTKYDDDAPFIYSKGNVIYFSSKGHNSIGGYDVFRSFYFDGNWTEPQNLGYPINTMDDDIYFSVSADGNIGYMGSKREGGYGLLDIYRMDLSNLKIPFMPVDFDSSFLDAFLEEIVEEEDTINEIIDDTTEVVTEEIDDSWKELTDDELYAYLLENFGNVRIDGLVFNIQIGAYRNPLGKSANLLAVADDVRTQKFNDLITRYFSGKFETLTAADTYRSQMIDLGVSDAFVVAFNNEEKLYLRQLAELFHSN